MLDQVADPFDYLPLGPVRCNRCGSTDILLMPVVGLMDRLRWAAFYGPFKCRECHKKFYRRVKKKSFLDS